MPDGAFEATERQFLDLLDAGSGCDAVEVQPLHHGRASRGASGPRHGSPSEYSPVEELSVEPARPADRDRVEPAGAADRGRALLGRPGRAADLGQGAGPLHAAVLPRRPRRAGRLRRHRPGARCRPSAPASSPNRRPRPPAGRRPRPAIVLPALAAQHGRRRRGASAPATGWPSSPTPSAGAWRPRTSAGPEVVLVQGHPEYDPSSLLREYHRDARRYVHHERDDLPCLPLRLRRPRGLGAARRPARADGRRRAGPGARRGVSPSTRWGPGPTGRGADVATGLYANWMAGVTEEERAEAHARRDHRHPRRLHRRRHPGGGGAHLPDGRPRLHRRRARRRGARPGGTRASTTTGSTTRPTTCWRSASPPSRAARPRWCWPRGWRR